VTGGAADPEGAPPGCASRGRGMGCIWDELKVPAVPETEWGARKDGRVAHFTMAIDDKPEGRTKENAPAVNALVYGHKSSNILC
jgi:hypothetical protein